MKDRISGILRSSWFVPTVIGVVSFGGGLGVGYVLAKRSSEEAHELPEQMEFDFRANELADIKDSLAKMKKARDEKEEKQWEPVEIITPVEDPPEETLVTFEEEVVNSDWDYELEVSNRNSDQPYVIHKDEFYAEEMDFTQITLTYYAGDSIMADEEDTPIYNFETVTGPLKFGHGSDDPRVLYVRNEKRRAEYEILLHDGLFSEEVLGLEIENNARVQDLQHSKNRKFRME